MQPESQPETIKIHRSSTTKFGDFAHGSSRLHSRPENQVNLLLLLLPQERGNYLASTMETRNRTPRETLRSIANSLNRKKHKLCLSISYYNTYNYIVATGRTDDKPTVCFYRRQWKPLPHGQFDLVPASH